MPNNIILSKYTDLLLIYCPFWVGLLYCGLIFEFSDSKDLIFVFFLLIFGESHFACTYLFFLDPKNKTYLRNNSATFLYLPLIILISYYFLAYFDFQLAILIAGVASGIHVTRQSIGINRIAGFSKFHISEWLTYFMSGIGLVCGFLRFHSEFLSSFEISWREIGIYLLSINLLLSLVMMEKNINKFASYLTSSCLYLAYLFVPEPQDAIAIGVGMHWCQYLAINYKVYSNPDYVKSSSILAVSLIITFTFIMTFFETSGFVAAPSSPSSKALSYFLLIPLTGQILHYYYDAFIWKFSNTHIRTTIGKALFR